MSVSISPPDMGKLRRELEAAKKRAEDLEPVMRGAAAALDAVIQRSFRSGRGPNGEAWEPLQPATIARKGSSKPLIDTGALMRSVNTQATERSVFFGVSGRPSRYGATHQFGRGPIPARPFLPLDRSGQPRISGGDMRRWYTKHISRRVRRYILEGKL